MKLGIHAASWLQQFEDSDKVAAENFLDSLTLISASTFENGIRERLEETLENLASPFALYAVREIDGEETQIPYLGSFPDRVYRPSAVPAHDIGSEGRIAHIISRLAASERGKYLDHPSIATMAHLQCRTIVFIDDLIGTGGRILSFAKHIYRHPTITSWHSYGLIKFVLVAYASTKKGLEAVNHLCSPKIDTVVFHRACPTLWDITAIPDVSRIRELCRKYARRASRPNRPLGHGNSATTMVFAHGCPNNAPPILWVSIQGGWRGVFPNRYVPAEMLPVFEQPLELQIFHRSSSAALEVWKQNPAILALFLREAGRIRKQSIDPIFRISIVTGLSIAECKSLRKLCIENGLLGRNWRLTRAGSLELARVKQRQLSTPMHQKECPQYFPRQLRPRPYLAEIPARPGSGPDYG